MNLVELRLETGEVYRFHPRVSVVTGLAEEDRSRLASRLAQILTGASNAASAVVEISGEQRQLTPEVAGDLGLPGAGAAVLLRRSDLPGAGPSPSPTERIDRGEPAHQPDVTEEPEPDDVPPEEPSAPPPPDPRLEEARAALQRAEAALAEVRAQLDPDALGELDAAEEELSEAWERASAALDEAGESEGSAARRSDLTSRRTALLLEWDETATADPGIVQSAAARLRQASELESAPSEEALALAERLAALRAKLAAAPATTPPPRWLVEQAEESLRRAREEFAEAERLSASGSIDPDEATALEKAHAAVLSAEQRVMNKRSLFAGRRLESAKAAERSLLERMQLSTFGAFLERLEAERQGIGAAERVERGRKALEEAEIVWDEVGAALEPADLRELREALAELRQRAIELLGADPGDDDLEAALRAYRELPPELAEARAALAEALHEVGEEVAGRDPADAADSWLTGVEEARRKRAQVEDDLSAVDAELASLEPSGGASPGVIADSEAALRHAEARVASAQQRLARHRGAETQVGKLESDVDHARAAYEHAVDESDRAEEGEEQARPPDEAAVAPADEAPAAEASEEPPADEPPAGDSLAEEVSPVAVEVAVLGRLSDLRSVGRVGSLPLVADDALAGRSDAVVHRILQLFERMSPSVQVLYLTNEARIEEWAQSLGPDAAVVVRAASA